MTDHLPRLENATTNARPPDRTPSPTTTQGKRAQKERPETTKCSWETDGGLCEFIAATAKDLTDHIELVHKRKIMLCHWRGCSRKNPSSNHTKWMEHVRTHTGYCPFVCEFCLDKYPQKYKLTHHLENHHPHRRPRFPPPITKRRKKSQKERPETLKCSWETNEGLCEFVAETPRHLTDHIASVHKEKKIMMCRWKSCSCMKPFINHTKWMEHLRTHTGYCPFVCEFCSYKFPQRSCFTTHSMKHHSHLEIIDELDSGADWSKIPLCLWFENDEFCTQQFQTPAELEQHIINEHLQRKDALVCYFEGCDRKLEPFAKRFGLFQHLNVHTKMKKFPCNFCTSRFTQSSNLRRHCVSHHGSDEFGRPIHASTNSVQTNQNMFGNSTIEYPAEQHQHEFNSYQNLPAPANYPSTSENYNNGFAQQTCRYGVGEPDNLEYEHYEVGQELILIEEDGEQVMLMEQNDIVNDVEEDRFVVEEIGIENENLEKEQWVLQEL